MDNKILELTEKIYHEGVEKGREEAQHIISEAKAEEQKILAEAQKQAQQIIADAQKNAQELKKNTEAELKLFARQCVESLKTEITNLITCKVTSDAVDKAFQDKDFVSNLILKLVEGFGQNESFVIQSSDKAALSQVMAASAKRQMKEGFKIESVNGIKSAFVLTPEDGSYKINFGKEEFMSYFQEFLRPQLIEMLFKS